MKYLFFLGNHPMLALAEIQSLLDFLGIESTSQSLSSDLYEVNTNIELPHDIIDRLGGTIKIAQHISDSDTYDAPMLEQIIDEKDRVFGLSFYNIQIRTFEILTLSKRIKKIIQAKDRKINFLVPRDGTALTSAQIIKKISGRGIEIIVLSNKGKFIIAKTVGSQNIDRWSRLDYGIPYSDPQKGMLPPKLAQIMINLALSSDTKNPIIYDPFCGCGRVMMQCSLSHFSSYASDIDKKSVSNTKANMQWLKTSFGLDSDMNEKIFEYDATKSGVNEIIKEKISAIVTEPYLGKPMKIAPSMAYINKMFTDLSEIYLQSLINMKSILKSDGRAVIVFPKIGDHSLYTKIVDKIENLGYHKVSNFNYSRSYQIVKREIVVFKLGN